MIGLFTLMLGVPAWLNTKIEPQPGGKGMQTAFLIQESGRLVGVDWIERIGNRLHSRAVLTQSRIIDATIELRYDETAIRSSVIVSAAGEKPGSPVTRELGEGAIYWSDMIPSSVEQAVKRARKLNQKSCKILAASLFSNTRGDIIVEQIDNTDWVVTYHDKRFEVLTDDKANMLSATLPDHGVVIERRTEFSPDDYPLWSAYGAPLGAGYSAVEVEVHCKQGHKLAGTLTRPLLGKGKRPAAILITGLSPSERNGGSPPWMPLRDLADALTRAGVIVLRVDDRGIGKSTGDHGPSTTFDEADDVRSELAWLRTQPGVDPRRVALVGYSEGGLIAPMVAASDPLLAAIVCLAGPGVLGPELARYQIENAVIRDPSIPSSGRDAEIAKQLADDLTPREKSFLSIDPINYAKAVRCRALILQGATDLVVPLRSSQKLAAAMRSNGNKNVMVRIIPGVSHSLLPDPLGPGSGWPQLPSFYTSSRVLDTMTQWITENLVRR